MIQYDKIKVLIEGIKTSNEVMQKQIELSNRTIDLLWQYVIEPESLEPINIKPQDMVSGEWYAFRDLVPGENWIFKHNYYDGTNIIHVNCVCIDDKYHADKGFFKLKNMDLIRKATREEVTKYFPNEFEIPTHGLNDVPNIPQVTDEQL